MDGRFRSFSFVDRITRRDGARIEGHYTVPAGATRFPASLMAEAVGQLAAWASMSQLEFTMRPVAGLAAESRYWQQPRPGQMLMLAADIERCDAEAVAYRGSALIDGQPAVEIVDCVGPMLPMAQFDAPERVRADFDTLCGTGAPADRFGGVPEAQVAQVETVGAEKLQALLTVPERAAAPYFDDHFPLRPVFPGTLLLDALAQLAVQLAHSAAPLREARTLVVKRVGNVKIRSFTEPGAVLQLEVELLAAEAQGARLKLAARAEGKTVATARAEVMPRSGS
jgi:3-hydroxymyristoyl/3-hydroxydecanoyl-(acyl carrier protein) dehydratase